MIIPGCRCEGVWEHCHRQLKLGLFRNGAVPQMVSVSYLLNAVGEASGSYDGSWESEIVALSALRA